MKWLLGIVGIIIAVFVLDVAIDLFSTGIIDARNYPFRKDEHSYPSTDGTKVAVMVVFHDEPVSTSIRLDRSGIGSGIFDLQDTGLALTVHWNGNDHLVITGPARCRTGLNLLNDTCTLMGDPTFVIYEAR